MMLKPGVRQPYLVRRRLKLKGEGDCQALVAVLAEELGVQEARCEGERLWLAYDAVNFQLERLAELLIPWDLALADKGWAGLRLGYYRFLDQNIRDNATHEPWCCHRLPPNIKK